MIPVKLISKKFKKNFSCHQSIYVYIFCICELLQFMILVQKYYQKYYLWQEEEDGLCHPVLDSLDNYKMLSERMEGLAIYLPGGI